MLIFDRPILAVAININDLNEIFNPASVTTEAIPKALNVMWNYALDGSIYKLICGLSMLVAIFSVGVWSVNFYKTLNEGTLLPAVNEVVWPLLIVMLLSNSGSNMRSATLGVRDLVNNVNNSVHRVVDLDVGYQTAFKVIARSSFDRLMMRSLYDGCEANIDQTKLADCLSVSQAIMNARLTGRFSTLISSSTKPEMAAAIKKFDEMDQKASDDRVIRARQSTDKGSVAETAGLVNNSNPAQIFNANRIIYGKNSPHDLGFQNNILALRKAFLYLLEVVMLVLGLVGPIFVGLSMFPFGTRPLISWISLFLSVGFCKICYALIAGLSAVAMVLSGPTNVDMLIFSVVVGGLSPILSLVISSILNSSLSGAMSSIAYPASGYGVNAGLTASPPPGVPADAESAKQASRGTNK